jgi:hypothetical protein
MNGQDHLPAPATASPGHGANKEPAGNPCQQCGGINATTGTICERCIQGLLAGQFAVSHRCERCDQPTDIAGRYCSQCLPLRTPGRSSQ